MKEALSTDEVLVFYGRISDFQDEQCLSVLSKEEIIRADQYLLPLDKQRYIISRAILKHLLSRFSGVNEQEILLASGKNGKPFWSNPFEIRFNLSHAGDGLVIGLSLEKEVGIDMERLDRIPNIPALETFLFTPSELELFHNLDPSLKQETFITAWTRKEAVLKASGEGLTKAMNELDVAFIKEKNFLMGKTAWFLESFTLMENYRGAVAGECQTKIVQYRSMNELNLQFNPAKG
jgi:4'-phosphopantetheinyl transferase